MNNFMTINLTKLRWKNCLTNYNLPKLTNELKIQIILAIKGIEFIIKTLSTKKISIPDSFAAEFYQKFKEELTPSAQTFRKEQEGIFPSSFYEASNKP